MHCQPTDSEGEQDEAGHAASTPGRAVGYRGRPPPRRPPLQHQGRRTAPAGYRAAPPGPAPPATPRHAPGRGQRRGGRSGPSACRPGSTPGTPIATCRLPWHISNITSSNENEKQLSLGRGGGGGRGDGLHTYPQKINSRTLRLITKKFQMPTLHHAALLSTSKSG